MGTGRRQKLQNKEARALGEPSRQRKRWQTRLGPAECIEAGGTTSSAVSASPSADMNHWPLSSGGWVGGGQGRGHFLQFLVTRGELFSSWEDLTGPVAEDPTELSHHSPQRQTRKRKMRHKAHVSSSSPVSQAPVLLIIESAAFLAVYGKMFPLGGYLSLC